MIWKKKKTNVKNIQYNPHYKTALFADQKRSYTGGGLITEVRPHEELGMEVSQQVYNFIGDRIIFFKKVYWFSKWLSFSLISEWTCLFMISLSISFDHTYILIWCIYLKGPLEDRLCLNGYPCKIKFNQSIIHVFLKKISMREE